MNSEVLGLINLLKKGPRKSLSIDFGQAFVKVVYMEYGRGGFKLLNYDLKKIISSESNKPQVIDFIANFLKTNSILIKDVYLTISDPESLIIKHLMLPVVPKEEILKAAKWQLKEEVHFDLETSTIDWQIAGEYTDDEGAKRNGIMFVLADTKVISKYLSIVTECGLNPIGITTGPFNYCHVLRYFKESFPIQAILDIGYSDTNLCIYKNNKLAFVRRLPFSSERLTRSLTSTLVSDKGKMELTYEEAEHLKNTFGIPEGESLVYKDNITASHIISLIRPLLEGLARELRRSFDYFTVNLKENIPSVLYITGGGANLRNLDKYLNRELNINVSKLCLPDEVNTQTLAKEKLDEDRNQIINAIGAILKGSSEINLLPPEFKTQKIEFIEKIFLRLAAFTVTVVFLFSLSVVRFQVGDYKNRLKNAKMNLETVREIQALKQKVDTREDLINKIQRNKVPVNGLLKLISFKISRNIILDELILDEASHNLILKGTISVSSDMAGSVLAKFMADMKSSPFFKEVGLLSSQKIDLGESFEIKCELIH